jgi:hypothetical protein
MSIWASILSVPPLISWYLDHFPSFHAHMPPWTGSISLTAGVGLAITALIANAVAHANLDRLLSDHQQHQTAEVATAPRSLSERKDVQEPIESIKAQWDSVFYPMMVHQPLSERIFADKSPQELISFFRNFIDVQAQKLIEPFIGKWLRISGSVHNATQYKGGGHWQVFIYLQDEPRIVGIQITLLFADMWTERLSLITRDTNITAIGRISKVGANGLELQACELVQV